MTKQMRVGMRYGSDRPVMQFPSLDAIPSELRNYVARAIRDSRRKGGELGEASVNGNTIYAWDEGQHGTRPFYEVLGLVSRDRERQPYFVRQ